VCSSATVTGTLVARRGRLHSGHSHRGGMDGRNQNRCLPLSLQFSCCWLMRKPSVQQSKNTGIAPPPEAPMARSLRGYPGHPLGGCGLVIVLSRFTSQNSTCDMSGSVFTIALRPQHTTRIVIASLATIGNAYGPSPDNTAVPPSHHALTQSGTVTAPFYACTNRS
jgi:hypothetical protein